MALTYSEMIPLGKQAPDFNLKGIDSKRYSIADFKGKKAIVVMFICNHCPYVVAVNERISKLAKEFTPKNVQFIGINSNDFERYPDDSPEHMAKQAKDHEFDFPYLIDSTCEVAKNYGAVCTPDIFVFDGDLKLQYRGRIDDNWKEPEKATKHDLKEALSNLVNGKPVNPDQTPSMGCSIKWRAN